MKMKQAIKKIDNEFFNKIDKIEQVTMKNKLDDLIKNIRIRILCFIALEVAVEVL